MPAKWPNAQTKPPFGRHSGGENAAAAAGGARGGARRAGRRRGPGCHRDDLLDTYLVVLRADGDHTSGEGRHTRRVRRSNRTWKPYRPRRRPRPRRRRAPSAFCRPPAILPPTQQTRDSQVSITSPIRRQRIHGARCTGRQVRKGERRLLVFPKQRGIRRGNMKNFPF